MRDNSEKADDLKKKGLNFHDLVSAIRQVHGHLSAQAGKAVNISLTLRNWVIGWYIAEFEFRGADRAEYGEKLLTELAGELTRVNVSNCNRRQLYRYLQFYRTYPQIVGTLSPQLKTLLPEATKTMEIEGTPSPQLASDPEDLINRFSYSHLEQLFSIDDPLKRGFYEIEYALAGMDNNLFVSKYLFELPKKEDMQRFLEERIKEVMDERRK